MRKKSKLFSFGELVLAGIAGYIFYKCKKKAFTKVQEAVDDICPDFIDIDLGYREDEDEEEEEDEQEETLPRLAGFNNKGYDNYIRFDPPGYRRSDAIHAIRELGKSANDTSWSSDKRRIADDIYEIGHKYRNIYGVTSVALSELSNIRKGLTWSSDQKHVDELIKKLVLV